MFEQTEWILEDNLENDNENISNEENSNNIRIIFSVTHMGQDFSN